MLLRLQQYEMNVRYKNGKEMVLADTLSRAYLPYTESRREERQDILETRSEIEIELEHINAVDCPFLTVNKVKEIQEATALDNTLQLLKSVIEHGWPDNQRKLNPLLTPYFQYRDELVTENGVIYRGNQCLIPVALRPYTLTRIHQSHIGTEGCIRRAKESVFWPGMVSTIRDTVSKCEISRTYERRQR